MADKTMEELFEEMQKAVEKLEDDGTSEEITKAMNNEGESEIVKAVSSHEDRLETLLKALVGDEETGALGMIARLERLESGTVVRKSATGQEGGKADAQTEEPTEAEVAKAADNAWRSLVKGETKALTLE